MVPSFPFWPHLPFLLSSIIILAFLLFPKHVRHFHISKSLLYTLLLPGELFWLTFTLSNPTFSMRWGLPWPIYFKLQLAQLLKWPSQFFLLCYRFYFFHWSFHLLIWYIICFLWFIFICLPLLENMFQEERSLFVFHGCIPNIQDSACHITGSPYIFVEWISEAMNIYISLSTHPWLEDEWDVCLSWTMRIYTIS